MKILKHGKVNTFVCDVCGCSFVAAEKECRKPEFTENKGIFVVCPDCGTELFGDFFTEAKKSNS